MGNRPSLDDFWDASQPAHPQQKFDPAALASLPPAVQRYLNHAIAPGTVLASAVRLRMHGEIKLKQWYPFSADQVIDWTRGMIWQASVRMHGVPIRGSDRLIDGQARMQWKILGLLPLVNAAGPDITRSAAGRMHIESIWLPSVLYPDNVVWTQSGPDNIHASFHAHAETAEIDYQTSTTGAPLSISMPRWGDPDHRHMGYTPFGGLIEAEQHFDGYTIPTRLRVGWHYGTDRFSSDGEFFRVTIDEAVYR